MKKEKTYEITETQMGQLRMLLADCAGINIKHTTSEGSIMLGPGMAGSLKDTACRLGSQLFKGTPYENFFN